MDIRDIIHKIDKVQSRKELTNEIKKININESMAINIAMYGNNEQELSQVMRIFKNAGVSSPEFKPIATAPAEASGYQGQSEPFTFDVKLDGDFEMEKGVSDKDAMEIKNILQKAGIQAEVNPSEEDFSSIAIKTMTPKEKIIDIISKAGVTVDEDSRYKASTTPDPKYASIPDTVDPTGDDLHKKKKMYARSHPGDNPMAVEQEVSLAEKIKAQLIADYAAFKEGQVKGMVMDIESDAAEMSKEEFSKKYQGKHMDIFNRIQKEKDMDMSIDDVTI